MKVIGIGERDTYLCTISHSELEKFLNQYYGNIKRLEVGATVDLAKGYDFMHTTKMALKETQDFIKSNKKVIESIITGINLMGNDPVKPVRQDGLPE